MQTACVIPTPLGFVCGSPSHQTTPYPSQSPLQQQKPPQISPLNSRRRSARNSVQIFLSSVIQYATADPSISPSSSSPPSTSRIVEFKKRDMTSTTAQDCSHPQISLLSEMLRRQMIGGIGNCGRRGIRFDCGSNGSRSVFTSTTSETNNNVSERKGLKFGDCPSIVRQTPQVQQPRQPTTILTNTNGTATTQASSIKYMTPVKTIDNGGTLISGSNVLTSTPTKFKKVKHLSPPPAKSLYLSKAVEANDGDEGEEEKDDLDDEDGYLEDDEEEDEEDEDDEEEEEEDDDGEELSPSNLIPSFDSTTRSNTKAQIRPISIVITSSEQEETTTTSSHYSTATSLLTPPNNINPLPTIRKAKSLPYRGVTSGDTTSDNWNHHNVEKMSPLVVRRRKLGVKSIPIPKNHFHEPSYHNTHKRRHGHQKGKNEDALWNNIVSRMAGVVDKSNKEDKEEDVLWPLSI